MVEALAKAGCSSVSIADLNGEMGTAAAKKLSSKYPQSKVRFVQTDVSKWEDQVKAFEFARKHSPDGKLDIVIPNAGVIATNILQSAALGSEAPPPPPSMTCIDVNITGVLYTTNLALHYFHKDSQVPKESPAAKPEQTRHLIFMGSLTSYFELPFATDYQTSKFAVRGMWKSLRTKAAAFGGRINMNLLVPNFIDTPLLPTGMVADLEKQGVRLGKVEDVVAAMMRCVGDEEGVVGRAIAVGRSGREEGREPGYFNFDVRDDYEGMDGGIEMLKGLKNGTFGEGLASIAR